MLLKIEIPPQEKTDWFKVESTCWITTSVVSTIEFDSMITFVLDPRVEDFTTGLKNFTVLRLNKYLCRNDKIFLLYAEFVPDENEDLNYFDGIHVNSVEVVKDFPSPLLEEKV